MSGSRNNINNRGTKQVRKTVLVVTFGPGLKMHKRFVHDEALYNETDARLAAGQGIKR